MFIIVTGFLIAAVAMIFLHRGFSRRPKTWENMQVLAGVREEEWKLKDPM